MPGVSWTERQPTDWLASNGRWYAESKYPRGWSTSALPPAPGHGGVGSILRRFVETAVESGTGAVSRLENLGDDDDWTYEFGDDESAEEFASGFTVGSRASGKPSASQQSDSSGPATTGAAMVPTGRRVAEATISEPSPKLGTPSPPPPASATSASLPAPPGRITQEPEFPPMPAPPTQAVTNVAPAPAPKSSFDVVAGDLGSVLGSAKRRIEQAINESAER